MDALRKSGDSVGARVDVVADGVPPGWGEPIYGKLDGELAAALMSINAVKGVEIGDGFAGVAQHGSEHRDEMTRRRLPVATTPAASSAASRTGQQVVVLGRVQADLEPAPAGAQPRHRRATPVEVVTTGRHDPCVGIRATPICEAMVALVLMDQALRHRAQCGDVGDVSPRIPAGNRYGRWRSAERAFTLRARDVDASYAARIDHRRNPRNST